MSEIDYSQLVDADWAWSKHQLQTRLRKLKDESAGSGPQQGESFASE
jgi:hypothetical protein